MHIGAEQIVQEHHVAVSLIVTGVTVIAAHHRCAIKAAVIHRIVILLVVFVKIVVYIELIALVRHHVASRVLVMVRQFMVVIVVVLVIIIVIIIIIRVHAVQHAVVGVRSMIAVVQDSTRNDLIVSRKAMKKRTS